MQDKEAAPVNGTESGPESGQSAPPPPPPPPPPSYPPASTGRDLPDTRPPPPTTARDDTDKDPVAATAVFSPACSGKDEAQPALCLTTAVPAAAEAETAASATAASAASKATAALAAAEAAVAAAAAVEAAAPPPPPPPPPVMGTLLRPVPSSASPVHPAERINALSPPTLLPMPSLMIDPQILVAMPSPSPLGDLSPSPEMVAAAALLERHRVAASSSSTSSSFSSLQQSRHMFQPGLIRQGWGGSGGSSPEVGDHGGGMLFGRRGAGPMNDSSVRLLTRLAPDSAFSGPSARRRVVEEEEEEGGVEVVAGPGSDDSLGVAHIREAHQNGGSMRLPTTTPATVSAFSGLRAEGRVEGAGGSDDSQGVQVTGTSHAPSLSLSPSSSSFSSFSSSSSPNTARRNRPSGGTVNVNRYGRLFSNGRPLSKSMRQELLKMHKSGFKPCEISRKLAVSHGCISKILRKYQKTGNLAPGKIGGSEPKVTTPVVVDNIRRYKADNGGLAAWRIQARLVSNRVCTQRNVPSVSSINRILRMISGNRGPNTPATSGEDTTTITEESTTPSHRPPPSPSMSETTSTPPPLLLQGLARLVTKSSLRELLSQGLVCSRPCVTVSREQQQQQQLQHQSPIGIFTGREKMCSDSAEGGGYSSAHVALYVERNNNKDSNEDNKKNNNKYNIKNNINNSDTNNNINSNNNSNDDDKRVMNQHMKELQENNIGQKLPPSQSLLPSSPQTRRSPSSSGGCGGGGGGRSLCPTPLSLPAKHASSSSTSTSPSPVRRKIPTPSSHYPHRSHPVTSPSTLLGTSVGKTSSASDASFPWLHHQWQRPEGKENTGGGRCRDRQR
ncbi:uncharacterized protein LOC143287710 [Babylonia areolata]|uniref:uncharacterized protein LOC143287710 n=1 Tax=Babylonia areolata TaxID=304850 RepID=UPI003FD12612